MKKYAVVGSGHFGSEFARAIAGNNECELVMVYSPSQSSEVLSKELSCPYTHDIDDIWNNKEIDAVIIASPNYLHKEQVIAAARAKKHIFCEKPFALNIEDAKEMLVACKEENVLIMVGHIMHFYDGLYKTKEMIDKGEFGEIINMHVERTGWESKKPQVSWKKMQDLSGGHLFHHIHEIDLVQWFMGLPTELYTVGGNLAHNQEGFGDEDDVILITLKFGNSGFVTMQYGSGFRQSNHIIRINGTKKGALIDFSTASVSVKSDEGVQQFPLFDDKECQDSILGLFKKTDAGIAYGSASQRPIEYIQKNLLREFSVFVDAVAGKEIKAEHKNLFDGTSALNSVIIASTCVKSRNTGKVEQI